MTKCGVRCGPAIFRTKGVYGAREQRVQLVRQESLQRWLVSRCLLSNVEWNPYTSNGGRACSNSHCAGDRRDRDVEMLGNRSEVDEVCVDATEEGRWSQRDLVYGDTCGSSSDAISAWDSTDDRSERYLRIRQRRSGAQVSGWGRLPKHPEGTGTSQPPAEPSQGSTEASRRPPRLGDSARSCKRAKLAT